MINLLKPGQIINIITINGKNDYKSKIENISNDGSLLIDTPIHNGHLIPLRIGIKLKIIFFNRRGQFFFNGMIINRFSGHLSYLQIKPISEISKLQRRQYYRLEKILEFKYKKLEDATGTFNKGYIKNISGGGLKVRIKEKLETNKEIICILSFDIPDDEIFVKSMVIRCELIDGSYETALKFIDIEDSVRERIISYIFKEERKLKKKY